MSGDAIPNPDPAKAKPAVAPPAQASPALRVHIVCGPIEDIGRQERTVDFSRIDAIAVGHYAQVEPQFAELALDNAISGLLPSLVVRANTDSEALGVITDFTTRGIIQGELGVPFFLPDPRDNRRIIVIAGMGPVGCFGAPELAFLVRQLLWALSRLRRKHLATVLIGSGTGDLSVEAAVSSWVNGAALAIAGSMSDPVEQITFVEHIPAKAEQIRSELLKFRRSAGIPPLEIAVTPSEQIPIPPDAPSGSQRAAASTKPQVNPVTRLWIERRGSKFLFGWFLNQASHLRDSVQLNLDTILSANDKLAAKEVPDHQKEKAEYLFNLLIPQTFHKGFARTDPIVIECDNRTAQIHWEMLVPPNLPRGVIPGCEYLGIHPTVTRQFRNSFGIPPEPPPRFDHTLRVLIVADTDANRRLPAAADEAEKISAMFGAYERTLRSSGIDQHVLVDSLVGPDQATNDNVLEKLIKDPPFDILHFCGHCEFVGEDPATSGWLFTNGEKITAYELTRVGCVPAFVFSNACSSGTMPPEYASVARRSVPSFAEAFFKQGVKNFVCTAWLISSDRAHDFACRFYEVLLGVNADRRGYMYEAMSEARKSIWSVTPSGTRTWGAYQHYGNPWHRLP